MFCISAPQGHITRGDFKVWYSCWITSEDRIVEFAKKLHYMVFFFYCCWIYWVFLAFCFLIFFSPELQPWAVALAFRENIYSCYAYLSFRIAASDCWKQGALTMNLNKALESTGRWSTQTRHIMLVLHLPPQRITLTQESYRILFLGYGWGGVTFLQSKSCSVMPCTVR